MKHLKELANEMFTSGTFENYDLNSILAVLTEADDIYYNSDSGMSERPEVFLTDSQYDALRKYAKNISPHHVYFTGVGSEIRGSKITLPYPMGSLDQVEIGDVKKWVKKHLTKNEDIVISDKLDGTSALVIYDEEGNFQIAYSRGDGIAGADITRHLKHFVPSSITSKNGVVIRGEIILYKTSFQILQDQVMSRSGKPYKNARNMVSGLINAETNNPLVYKHLQFVAFDLMEKGIEYNKSQQFTRLLNLKFGTVNYVERTSSWLTDENLSGHLNFRRGLSPYEMDGLVIDVDNFYVRKQMNPTRDTLNPAYAFKYKVTDTSNQTIATVRNVIWNISKDGYLKPQVAIEPVELNGVTISNLTGFNARFIYGNKIGPGAKVRITRSGEVIPIILEVVEAMPVQELEINDITYDKFFMHQMNMYANTDWEWNETCVDVIVTNPHESEEVAIQQTLNFFSSIDIPSLKERTTRKMFEIHKYENSNNAIISMINYPEDEWVNSVGANGRKIYKGLCDKKGDMPLYLLAGASPLFGRGVGRRKFKKLFSELDIHTLENLSLLTKEDIISVEGFEEKTAIKIITGIDKFIKFANALNGLKLNVDVLMDSNRRMAGEKVCFTGFRDKQLQSRIEAEGGTVQSSASRKTTLVIAKNPDANSAKLKKARELGIKIIGIEKFKNML
jgi:DNA ligase (NAD+)